MGGKAFLQHLPAGSFPRMSPELYETLKARYLSCLAPLFGLFQVPTEAPEKADHGDIDFVVAHSLRQEAVTPEDVKDALGASHAIPMEGPRTSFYAVPIPSELFGETNKFVQVDVHVCENEEDWKKYVLWHSCGDVGLIIGMVVKSVGLALSWKGLKISRPRPEESHPTSLLLSTSLEEIFPFLGLDLQVWQRGFTSRQAIFDWIASCRCFHPERLVREKLPSNAHERGRSERTMYQAFLDHSRLLLTQNPPAPELNYSDSRAPHTKAYLVRVREEALRRFDKTEEYEKIVHENWVRTRLKSTFTGTKVIEWTGLWGIKVRLVMNEVRRRAGGEDALARMEEAEVRALVMESFEALRGNW